MLFILYPLLVTQRKCSGNDEIKSLVRKNLGFGKIIFWNSNFGCYDKD